MWIFFIYDPLMVSILQETLNLSMGLEIRIAFSKQQRLNKNRKEKLLFQSIPGDYKNPGKIPCSFASFLHEREAARRNRVT